MTSVFIEPNDVLLFRDGRSFAAARGDRRATGVFPPPPTTVYGALRSALLSEVEAVVDASDFGLSGPAARVIGTQSEPGTLSIDRFALARRTQMGIERLYPVPNDVLVRKEDRGRDAGDREYARLRPGKDAAGPTNLPEGLYPLQYEADGVFTNIDGYLPESAFLRVLRGEIEATMEMVKPEALFRPEPRTSVAIGDGGTGREGLLYTVDFTRTKTNGEETVGLAVSLADEEDLLPDSGWLRLGGEARSARYWTGEATSDDESEGLGDAIRRNEGRFTLVLTTPVAFDDGWCPDPVSPVGSGTLAGCAVQLQGAAVGRYEALGGWDLAKGRPKPTRRAVPAGSAYFFKLDDPSDADRLVEEGPVLSLASSDADRNQGLGLAYLGTYSCT
jgi:CRISPR-associated protein Cmr3